MTCEGRWFLNTGQVNKINMWNARQLNKINIWDRKRQVGGCLREVNTNTGLKVFRINSSINTFLTASVVTINNSFFFRLRVLFSQEALQSCKAIRNVKKPVDRFTDIHKQTPAPD